MRKILCTHILMVALCGFSMAGNDPAWLRYPAISPDGTTIVFCYKGDLYRVAAEGGEASPLTLYEGHDFMPVWSADGKQIAFASDRNGNFDVYVMPARGGRATRLTYHSADDFPNAFTPDGSKVLFTSERLDNANYAQYPSRAFSEMYLVSIDGGRVDQMLSIPGENASFSKDGGMLLFEDIKGGENAWRKHHTSSVTRDIRIWHREDNRFQKISTFEGEDRDPVFSADEKHVFYLSEREGTFNVFRQDIAGKEPVTALTSFKDHPIRFLSKADNDTLCFGWHGEIYTMAQGGEPRKLAVSIFADDRDRVLDTLSVNDGAQEMAVSPNGKEIALIWRGEVFVTSTQSAVTRQITHTPEQERSVSFSPDGRSLLYASERGGSWNIYRSKLARKDEDYFFMATLTDEETLVQTDAETFQPAWSPDGKEIAFLENRTTLKVLNLESKEVRDILAGNMNFSYADGDQYFQWSPDGLHFLVKYQLPNYWQSEVGLISSDGKGEVYNLSANGFDDSQPKWMMGGKMMLWFSSRDGMRSMANSGATQSDAYGMFFTQKAYDRFRLSKEEYDLLLEKEKEAKKSDDEKAKKDEDDDKAAKKKKKKKKKDDETEVAEKEEKKLEPVEIQLDGLRDRKARLTIHSSNMADAVVTPDGEKLLYLTRFEKQHDLWQTDLRTRETKVLTRLGARGGSLALDKDGENVFVLAGGKLYKVEIKTGQKKGIPYSGEMQLNGYGERAYLFEHVWRQVREKFYDADLHGARWDALKPAYASRLEHISNNYDFAEFLSELLGELNASHTGARYRSSSKGGDKTASLGVYFDQAFEGPGLMVAEVLPKSPLVKDGSRLEKGVVIEKLDGVVLDDSINIYKLLNRKADTYVLLSLYQPASGERWDERVKPIADNEESALVYERWVKRNREKVDELSDGRIAYVHVPNMSDPSYRSLYEVVMGEHANKDALIVDTRFNSGGDLVEDLSNFLNGHRYMDFVTREGRRVGSEPQRRWFKPSVVLQAEGNYSDAHCFPWAYNHLKLGKLIGMPVPGTCTFVWWERLQDPSLVFGIPNLAVMDMENKPLENQQLYPDVQVENELEEMLQGRDQQLEAAVAELMNQLAGNGK